MYHVRIVSTVFRVVVIADRHEVLRSPSLFVACARWVKDPDRRRVEELTAGTETVVREVSRNQCCEVLREWIPKDKNLSADERADLEQCLREAFGKS